MNVCMFVCLYVYKCIISGILSNHQIFVSTHTYTHVDRSVVLGNHRDAWVFGAVDPNSGTAALMSLAKVIGQLRSEFRK